MTTMVRELVGSGDHEEGRPLTPDTEQVVVSWGEGRQAEFDVQPADGHDGHLELVERGDESGPKARALFKIGAKLHPKHLVPDMMKGEEGRKFRVIAAALGSAAAAGAAFIYLKKRSTK